MFIISVDGGLGNQMFEYAFYLAMKKNFPDGKVMLDLSMLEEDTHNGYELQYVFGINAPIAALEDVAKLSEYCPRQIKHNKLINQLNKLRRAIWGTKWSYIVQEDSTVYYDDYFHLSMLYSYYLRGVWANSQYFKDVKKKVLEEFTFPEIADEKNKVIAEEIRNTNSVGIHFRKGDYVEFGFEILDKSYYNSALQYINERVAGAKFFVFSDDKEGAKATIGGQIDYVFIDGNTGRNAYIDMNLMSMCKHNIIANSTFSFWGAFLNRNLSKIVVYPLQPIKGCKYPYMDNDWVGL